MIEEASNWLNTKAKELHDLLQEWSKDPINKFLEFIGLKSAVISNTRGNLAALKESNSSSSNWPEVNDPRISKIMERLGSGPLVSVRSIRDEDGREIISCNPSHSKNPCIDIAYLPNLIAAALEFGKTLVLTSAFRTQDEQKHTGNSLAAESGLSFHNSAAAFDISPDQVDKVVPILRKWGFSQPMANIADERNHIVPNKALSDFASRDARRERSRQLDSHFA